MHKYYIDIERITTERTSVLVVASSQNEAIAKCLNACDNNTIKFDNALTKPDVKFDATSNLECTNEDGTLDEEQYSVDGAQIIN